MPNAFPRWLDERDGVLLVGCVGQPAAGGPLDVEGEPLEVGQWSPSSA